MIKKTIAGAVAALLSAGLCSLGVTAQTPPFLLGDITCNGQVDITDALRLFQYSMMPDVYPLSYRGNIDYSGDGAVDLVDALRLFQYSMMPDIYPLRTAGFTEAPSLAAVGTVSFTPAFDGTVYYYYAAEADCPAAEAFRGAWETAVYRGEVTVTKGQAVSLPYEASSAEQYPCLVLALCFQEVEYMTPASVALETEAPPTSLTYGEYLAMSAAEQTAFIKRFPSTADFFAWRNAAKVAYDAQNPDIEIGDGGDIDLGGA